VGALSVTEEVAMILAVPAAVSVAAPEAREIDAPDGSERVAPAWFNVRVLELPLKVEPPASEPSEREPAPAPAPVAPMLTAAEPNKEVVAAESDTVAPLAVLTMVEVGATRRAPVALTVREPELAASEAEVAARFRDPAFVPVAAMVAPELLSCIEPALVPIADALTTADPDKEVVAAAIETMAPSAV